MKSNLKKDKWIGRRKNWQFSVDFEIWARCREEGEDGRRQPQLPWQGPRISSEKYPGKWQHAQNSHLPYAELTGRTTVPCSTVQVDAFVWLLPLSPLVSEPVSSSNTV